jgi:hypothetical protein
LGTTDSAIRSILKSSQGDFYDSGVIFFHFGRSFLSGEKPARQPLPAGQ